VERGAPQAVSTAKGANGAKGANRARAWPDSRWFAAIRAVRGPKGSGAKHMMRLGSEGCTLASAPNPLVGRELAIE